MRRTATGCSIICYDHGGQTDFLTSGRTGYVVPLNELTAFTKAVQDLSDQPQLRQTMAQNNRRLVEDYFIDKCATRYETVFEDAVRQYASRGGQR